MFSKNLISEFVNQSTFGIVKAYWWQADHVSQESPILICGAPRTGSTLIRSRLNNHPDIWIGPENGIFQEAGKNLAGMETCLRMPKSEIAKCYRSCNSLGKFIDNLMKKALAKREKSRWGIKSPAAVGCLDQFFRYFPNGRFVHTMRDGRDVVASLREHPKYVRRNGNVELTGISNPWSECVRRWHDACKLGLRYENDSRYYPLRYEEMVVDPKNTISRLLQWLGHDPVPALINYDEANTDEGCDTPHPGIKKGIHASALGRWKRDLPPETLALFGKAEIETLRKSGYPV